MTIDQQLDNLMQAARQESSPTPDITARVMATIRQQTPIPVAPLAWWAAAAAAAALIVFSALAYQSESDPQSQLFDEPEMEIVVL